MMKRHLAMSFAVLLSLPMAYMSFSAIITERNDVYNHAGCYSAPAYTFIGTPSFPGIDSCWIPYGTYTGGTGGTEYTRVTSNLMGVVVSSIAGLDEREKALYDGFQSQEFYMLRPLGIPDKSAYWRDGGEFLESSTNRSLRIADQLNLPLMRVYHEGTNYSYTVMSSYAGRIEPRLLGTANYFGSRKLESMLTAQGHSIDPPISSEWSSALPYNIGDTNLWRCVYPVLGYCTNDIHFLPYGAMSRGNWNAFPSGWSWSSLESVWGHDVVDAFGELVWGVDTTPLPFTIEDVLSADTGWKYEYPPKETNSYWTVSGPLGTFHLDFNEEYEGSEDIYTEWTGYNEDKTYVASIWTYCAKDPSPQHYDMIDLGIFTKTGQWEQVFYCWNTYSGEDDTEFGWWEEWMSPGPYIAHLTRFFDDRDDYTHWTNGTTRLDWKRLGIICQLERQMDITYESLSVTDELPLWHMATSHDMGYRSTPIEIPLPVPTHSGQEVGPISGLFGSAIWDIESEDYSASTNNSLWSTPTCRTPAPTVGMFASFLNTTPMSSDVVLDRDVAETMISDLSSQLENSTGGVMSHVEFGGMWGPLTGGMTLDFLCTNFSGRGVVALPSNTVEVTSSTGAHEITWRDEPIVARLWYLESNKEWWDFYPQSLPDGIVRLHYGYFGSGTSGGCDITVRTGSYDALNGSISAPQITFTAVGGGSVRDGMWHLSGIEGLPDDSQCIRHVEDSSHITWEWEGSNAKVRYAGADYLFYFEGDMGEYSIKVDTFIDTPIVESSPGFSYTSRSFAAKWSTSSYQEEVDITSTNTFLWSGVPVIYEGANVTNDAYASMSKNASATFTFAHVGNRDDIISRFNPSYYSLDWNRIQSLRRSELELMISARGAYSQSRDTLPSWEGNFTWEAIVDLEHAYRTFRMRNGTAETSLLYANYARYDLLAGLSAECKRECQDRGGIPIGAIEDVGKITREERESFLSVLRNATVSGHFGIVGFEDFLIKADVHKSDGVYEVDNIITPDFSNPRGVTIGSYGWTLFIDYNASSVTNRYRDVRADGYQAPVRKTLWRFKNLRDPGLR